MNDKYLNEKLNNDGFTLAEMLVALAISGIVIIMIATLMTTGSKLFKQETDQINLQNELQMVDNFLTETIMEAKVIDITNASNSDGDSVTTYLYTGIKGTDGVLTAVPDIEGNAGDITTERVISFNSAEDSLFINKSFVASPSKGSLVSDNVTMFKVSIDESCMTYKMITNSITGETSFEHEGFENPIVLNVELVVSDGKNEKKDTVSITVRNELTKVIIDGTEYTVRQEVEEEDYEENGKENPKTEYEVQSIVLRVGIGYGCWCSFVWYEEP